MKKRIVNPGQKYGHWTVIKEVGRKSNRRQFLVRCKCGFEANRYLVHMTSGKSIQCNECSGKKGRKYPKGSRAMPAYNSYESMMQRCTNPNATGYDYYGGRGITVCSRWNGNPQNFIADMGERPEGTSLDRIDSTKNYSPDNCRWANRTIQARNMGNNVRYTVKGESLTCKEWEEKTGINASTIKNRIKRGWSVERAVQAPVNSHAARYEANGINLTLTEWSEKTGLKRQTLIDRLKSGWSIERAVTEPIKHHA